MPETDNIDGREHLKTAVDLRACVGMWAWKAFAFTSSCPIDERYCFELASVSKGLKRYRCPYFCEVETVDNLVSVKCDHPEAESDYD